MKMRPLTRGITWSTRRKPIRRQPIRRSPTTPARPTRRPYDAVWCRIKPGRRPAFVLSVARVSPCECSNWGSHPSSRRMLDRIRILSQNEHIAEFPARCSDRGINTRIKTLQARTPTRITPTGTATRSGRSPNDSANARRIALREERRRVARDVVSTEIPAAPARRARPRSPTRRCRRIRTTDDSSRTDLRKEPTLEIGDQDAG